MSGFTSALGVIDELRERGVELRLVGDGQISAHPRNALDDDARAAIVEHKPALLRLLRQEPCGPPEDAVRQRERELRERLPETTRNGGHIMLRAVRPGEYAPGICVTCREPAPFGWMRCQVCAEAARRLVAQLMDARRPAATRSMPSPHAAASGADA